MMRGLGRALKGTLRFFDKLEYFVLVFLLAMMVVLAFLQIVLRIFFATGITWGAPLLRHLVLWLGLLGATMAAKEGKHINIDVISRLLPGWGKGAVQALIDLFSAFICILLLSASLIPSNLFGMNFRLAPWPSVRYRSGPWWLSFPSPMGLSPSALPSVVFVMVPRL
jgi:TRAP-type C4-dicarboxylate transport system permease small subunit